MTWRLLSLNSVMILWNVPCWNTLFHYTHITLLVMLLWQFLDLTWVTVRYGISQLASKFFQQESCFIQQWTFYHAQYHAFLITVQYICRKLFGKNPFKSLIYVENLCIDLLPLKGPFWIFIIINTMKWLMVKIVTTLIAHGAVSHIRQRM